MALFKCEHLNKTIGTYKLNDINFELEPGMVLGLIGVNGSGKTTLLRSIMGSYRLDEDPSDSGQLWINDKHFQTDMKEYRSSIAYVLQESPFSRYMTVKEIGETYGHYYNGFDMGKYLKLLKEYDVPEKKWNDWLLPEFKFTTDNAAMIAVAGWFRYKAGERTPLDVAPVSRMADY